MSGNVVATKTKIIIARRIQLLNRNANSRETSDSMPVCFLVTSGGIFRTSSRTSSISLRGARKPSGTAETRPYCRPVRPAPAKSKTRQTSAPTATAMTASIAPMRCPARRSERRQPIST